ncbi:dTDP-6-deoxy-L-hexose 3-O-methyltransferase [Escherichia coli]
MTTMNREEQKQVLIDTANHIIHRDNTSPYSENLRELARIALAALEVEPIGFRCRRNDNLGDWSYVYHREPDDFERKHLVIEGIYAAPPVPVVPEEKPMPNPLKMYAVDAVAAIAEVRGRNACRAAMLQSGNFREISETSTNSPITLTPLPGGFTIEDAKELHEDLVRSHISQALSGEKMKKKDRDADLLWIHGVIVQAAWFVKASLDALPEPLREEKGGSPTEESEAGL